MTECYQRAVSRLLLTLLLLTICGADSLAGETSWTTSGPAGTRIKQLEADPLNPNVILASVMQSLYLSDDSGRSWSLLPTLPGPPVAMVITRTGKICVANGSLYVGSGSFWQRTSLPPGHPVTYCLEEDPANPETLYLGTSKGLFFTRDLGATWFPLNDDLVDPNGYVYPILALAFHPQTPGIVYAGTWNGILRTVNGGITWDLLNPACRNTVALAFDPADSDTIYAGSKAFEGGIFRSQDAGATWTPLGLGGIQVQAIGVSASKPGLLYAGTSHRDLYTSGGLYISEDYGQTWVVSRKGCTYGSVQSLVVDSGYPGLVLAGADDGVFRSEDHGVTWSTAHPEVNTV
ncbi:MAG: hypothetical protein EHM18_14930, partial [Acidobacteria bacterium]